MVWNYLRVRGEYLRQVHVHSDPFELPPRARRIPPGVIWVQPANGTTSACAENTKNPDVEPPHTRNYLRVRGEY